MGVACVDLMWTTMGRSQRSLGFDPSPCVQFLRRDVNFFSTIYWLQVVATLFNAFTLIASCCCHNLYTTCVECLPMHIHGCKKNCQLFYWTKTRCNQSTILDNFVYHKSTHSWISHGYQNPCYI